MTTLYRYPKQKHVRFVATPKYKKYSSYKRALRIEFGRCCVYCRIPDSLVPNGHWQFAVEHYRPKKPGLGFEHLEREYSNLFYACATCNVFKGEAWWQPDFVPNPCDHEMFRHLHFVGSQVQSKSESGRRALELLHLNDVETVQFREKQGLVFALLIAELRKQEEFLARAKLTPSSHPQYLRIVTASNSAGLRKTMVLDLLLDMFGNVDTRDEALRTEGIR